MPSIYIKECPVCGSNELSPFLTTTDFSTNKESFTIQVCNRCSFLLTNPQPDEQSIGKYYQFDNYISHRDTGRSALDLVYLSIKNINNRRKLNIIRKYNPTGTLLDYGCATGEFLNYANKYNYTCLGVEPADNPRAIALSKQLTVFANISEIPNKLDVVTAWHVIEHVHKLNETLEKLTNSLTNSGTIFLAVPNHESLDAKIYSKFWAAWDTPRHLWHFNKKTMTALLSNHHLKVIDILPMPFDAYYVSILSEKYKNNTLTPVNFFRALINGLRSNWAQQETPNHSSLLYIAQHA